MLLDRPPFTPFTEPRLARPPGLEPLDPADWTLVHADFAHQMARRAALIAGRRGAVLACLAPAGAAAAEMLDLMLAHLAGRPDYRVGDAVVRPDGVTIAIDRADPMATLGRLIAEDVCLMLPDPGAEYVLGAAALCFPSRWLLAEKLGRPLTAIHAPVPSYDDVLARRVNRVFEALRVGAPLVRTNWLIHATAELHLPPGESDALMAAADPESALYLRTERQSLTRLPQTGAVAFLIKTSLVALDRLTAAEAAAALREFAVMAPEVIAHRAGSPVHRAALRRLAAIAGAAA